MLDRLPLIKNGLIIWLNQTRIFDNNMEKQKVRYSKVTSNKLREKKVLIEREGV